MTCKAGMHEDLLPAQALHLFAGFSYDRHPHILDEASVSLAQLTLTLDGTEFAAPPRTDCAWDGSCPACADPRVAGRWIVRDPAGLGLETSCIVTPSMRTKDGNPVCGDKKLQALATTWRSAQGLSYQPYGCRHAPTPLRELAGHCIFDRLSWQRLSSAREALQEILTGSQGQRLGLACQAVRLIYSSEEDLLIIMASAME